MMMSWGIAVAALLERTVCSWAEKPLLRNRCIVSYTLTYELQLWRCMYTYAWARRTKPNNVASCEKKLMLGDNLDGE